VSRYWSDVVTCVIVPAVMEAGIGNGESVPAPYRGTFRELHPINTMAATAQIRELACNR
jgi:hypothetical protein